MAEELKTLFSSDFAVVEQVTNPLDYASDTRYRKLGRDEAMQISGLVQFIPREMFVAGTETLYRVEFPAGVYGYLSQHGNGYLSSMHDFKTGDFVGQAVYVPVQQSIAMFRAFQALSIVTSQYYLHAINQQLSDIQSKLDKVLEFLYDDKACEIYAEATSVQEIYQNYSSLMNSDISRIVSVSAVRHAMVVAEKNIQFYYRDIEKLIPEIRKGDAARRSIDAIRSDLTNYNQAMNLFGVCEILEILLTQNFDKAYMKYKENDLNRHFNIHNIMVAKLQGKLETLAQLRNPPKLDELIKDVSEMLEERSPVKDFDKIVAQIASAFTAKTEYRILNDGTVFQKV